MRIEEKKTERVFRIEDVTEADLLYLKYVLGQRCENDDTNDGFAGNPSWRLWTAIRNALNAK